MAVFRQKSGLRLKKSAPTCDLHLSTSNKVISHSLANLSEQNWLAWDGSTTT